MYRLAYLANFILTAGAGVVFALLSNLQTEFGVSDAGIGFIAASGFLGALITQVALAPFADRGQVTLVAAVGLIAGAAGSFLFIVADEVVGFSASRALIGVGIGLFIVASRKAVIGLDEEGSGTQLGTLLSSNVAGFILGPVLGALLVERFGIDAPFVVLGVATLLVTPPALWWIKDAPVATSEVRYRDMIPLVRRPGVQAAMAAQVVFFTNIGIFDSTLDVYFTDLGASDTMVALLLLLIGLPLLILPTFTGRLVDRDGGERVMLLALAATVPALLGYGIAPILAVVALAGVCQTTVESFAFPATQVVVVKETGASEAAIGQALLDIVGSSMAASSSFVAPLIYSALGARGLFSLAALNAAAMLALSAQRLRVRDRQPHDPVPAGSISGL